MDILKCKLDALYDACLYAQFFRYIKTLLYTSESFPIHDHQRSTDTPHCYSADGVPWSWGRCESMNNFGAPRSWCLHLSQLLFSFWFAFTYRRSRSRLSCNFFWSMSSWNTILSFPRLLSCYALAVIPQLDLDIGEMFVSSSESHEFRDATRSWDSCISCRRSLYWCQTPANLASIVRERKFWWIALKGCDLRFPCLYTYKACTKTRGIPACKSQLDFL